MEIKFREINYKNKNDKIVAVTMLNEFMNREKNNGEIEITIIEKIQNLGYAKIYFCEDANDVIGIAVCFKGFSTYKQRELLNIHDFYIRSNYQGKGIGKNFLDYIQDECKRNNYCRVTLEVYNDNINAIKLYKKCGFIGSTSKENDQIIYAMKKDLD
jgi:ribosomal protein S18 acetylase RimI-like enzyme